MPIKGWAALGAAGAVAAGVHIKRHYTGDPVGSRTCRICQSFEGVQKRLPLPNYDVLLTIDLGLQKPLRVATTVKAPTRHLACPTAKAWLLGVLPDAIRKSGYDQPPIGRVTAKAWRV